MAHEKESSSSAQTSLWPLALLGTLFALLSLPKSPKPTDEANESVRSDYSPKPESGFGQSRTPIVAENGIRPVPNTITYKCEHETPPWKKRLEYRAVGVALGLLVINGLLLVVTERANEAVIGQLTLQRQIARLNGGAQLHLEGIPFFHQGQKTVSAGFVLRNDGNKSARNISVCSDIRFQKPSLATWDDSKCKLFEPANVIRLPVFEATKKYTAGVESRTNQTVPSPTPVYIYILSVVRYTDELSALEVRDDFCNVVDSATVFDERVSPSGAVGHYFWNPADSISK